MDPPNYIALVVAICVVIQTGLRIREHLTDYPLRKPPPEPEPEG